MIEIRRLTAGYPGNTVLKDLDLSVPEGQITVIVGPNGCGKTTLLKALVGILPSEGEILLGGEAINRMTAREQAKKIAYLPQNRTVPEITAGRLVLHGRFPYLSYPRRYRAEDYRIAQSAMEQMGITSLANRLLPSLSGGERQKVYIAMVLAQGTDLVVMDEPTSYLDISHKFEVIRLARELKQAGKTVILVLHDLDIALRYADQLVLMDKGTVCRIGSPEEMLRSGEMEKVFSVSIGRMESDTGTQYYFYPNQEA